MSGYSVGRRRKRVYARKFDWDEARRLRAEGWTLDRIADRLGVNRQAVARVCKMEETPQLVASVSEVLFDRAKQKDRCPTCGGWKSLVASQCQPCFAYWRLQPIKLERIPGKRRVRLSEVKLGRAVKYRGTWGVVENGGHRHRKIDYWELPAEIVPDNEIVDVAPSWRVFVEGEEQEAEAIA